MDLNSKVHYKILPIYIQKVDKNVKRGNKTADISNNREEAIKNKILLSTPNGKSSFAYQKLFLKVRSKDATEY